MKEVLIGNFYGVSRVVYVDKNSTRCTYLGREYSFEDGQDIALGQLCEEGGCFPFCEERVLRRSLDKARSLGIFLRIRCENRFTLKSGKGLLPFSMVDGEERVFIDNIYKYIDIDNIQYNTVSEKVREVSLDFLEVEECAKMTVKLRHVIKREGNLLSLFPTFLPKPFARSTGAGFCVEFEIKGEGLQVERFLAGLALHAPECVVFTNSIANSYPRLGSRECEDYVSVGESGGLVKIKRERDRLLAKMDFPDSSGNVFLLFSALITAGVLGVREELRPVDEIDDLTPSVIKDLVRLPTSLDKALQISEGSGFLKEVLGEGLGNTFVVEKKKEIEEISSRATEEEFLSYYGDIL